MKKKVAILLVLILLVVGLSTVASAWAYRSHYKETFYAYKSFPVYAKDVIEFYVDNVEEEITSCDPYQVSSGIGPIYSASEGEIKVIDDSRAYWIVRSTWKIRIGFKGFGTTLKNITCYYEIYPDGTVELVSDYNE